MRLIAVYHKKDAVAYISHLDVQRTLQRAFRRAEIPLAYSNGFNPHPLMSFASALGTGSTSDAEWFEVQIDGVMDPADFVKRVNRHVPPDFFLSDAMEAPEKFGTLSALTRGAEYLVLVNSDKSFDVQTLQNTIRDMLSGEIIVNKRTKSGIKPVDIRPQIIRVSVERIAGDSFVLRIRGKLQADGGLRTELFVGALLDRLDAHGLSRTHRLAMYFESDGLLPRLPLD